MESFGNGIVWRNRDIEEINLGEFVKVSVLIGWHPS